MKNFFKAATLLPIIIGVIAGALLFALGSYNDAPGLSLLGLVIAFLLVMWGIYQAGLIKKGFLAAIILLCFGVGAIVLSIVLLIDGEFGKSPGWVVVGIALGLVLIAIGAIILNRAKEKNK